MEKENQEAEAEVQKNQRGVVVHPQESEKVVKNADNGEIVLQNSDLVVMKNEEESVDGEIDIPKTSLSQHIRCIHKIFMSRSYQFITKEELKHKIICYSLDITESRETDEILEHLVNLVPEWISKKSMFGGEVYSINRIIDVESVLTKVEQR